MAKRHKDMEKVQTVIGLLANDDESLELHDLTLARTGTHADLFKK
ncbi:MULTISPECIES: type II toxin-antitoxin system YafQ family toxin [Thiothrix]|uniref:Type II toxin-antitoxin system YafQ family toxin n=2 Tax=Thiothrix TaxID=1030 RepID=A0AA51MLG8_9GAMM|nr:MULTISPECIES: type II toxin-antitoxin system YafQ family toxin [Thiothrix]MDQ5768864.1 type II toxin-antitoxin system YafQ family toxin [Thiothrix subterranea]UJS26556.1 type II toxin-antitoxin system YafQ family toxin [Thiothrix winogradskyi]WML86455.1 type II toxin-antitoxin system YafQ family toxin [Thiothrix subterranea]